MAYALNACALAAWSCSHSPYMAVPSTTVEAKVPTYALLTPEYTGEPDSHTESELSSTANGL